MSTASFTRMRSEERFRKASERLRDQIPNDLIIPLKEIKCPEFDGCAKVSDKVAQLQKSVESCIQAGKGQVGKPEQPRSDKIIEKTIASWFRAAYPFMTLLLGVVKESSQIAPLNPPAIICGGLLALASIAYEAGTRKEKIDGTLEFLSKELASLNVVDKFPDSERLLPIQLQNAESAALDFCAATCEYLTVAYKSFSRCYLSNVGHAIVKPSPLRDVEEKLQKAKEAYNSSLLSFNTAIGMENFIRTEQVHSNLDAISLNIDIIPSAVSEQLAAKAKWDNFEEWLSFSKDAVEAERVRNLERQDTTNLGFQESTSPGWIFEQPEFSKWLASTDRNLSMLWLSATAGFGKSVLAAYLTESIKQRYPSSGVAYFFCKDNERLSEPHCLIRTMLYQSSTASPNTKGLLYRIWDTNPSIASCTGSVIQLTESLLLPGLASLSTEDIFFIIDGLNECPEHKVREILRVIIALRRQSPNQTLKRFPNIRILLTSQETDRIKKALQDVPRTVLYGLNERNIESYVTQTLESDPILSENFKKTGKDPLSYFDKCNHRGMFLWVSLMLETLGKMPLDDFAPFLEKVPKDLNYLYGKVLERLLASLEDLEIKRVKEILVWLTTKNTCLTLRDLQLGIAVMRNPNGPIQINTLPEIEVTLRKCGAFIQVVPLANSEPSEETISLVHSSFKDFITTSDTRSKCPEALRIDPISSNASIATSCLLYLSRIPRLPEPSKTLELQELRKTHDCVMPFFLAAADWRVNLRKATSLAAGHRTQLFSSMLEFLKEDNLVKWLEGIIAFSSGIWNWEYGYGIVKETVEDLLRWMKAENYHLHLTNRADLEVGIISTRGCTADPEELNERILYSRMSRAAAIVWLSITPKYACAPAAAFDIMCWLDAAAAKREYVFGTPRLLPAMHQLIALANGAALSSLPRKNANIARSFYRISLSERHSPERARINLNKAKQLFTDSLQAEKFDINEARLTWCDLCATVQRLSVFNGYSDLDYTNLKRDLDRVWTWEGENKPCGAVEEVETLRRLGTFNCDFARRTSSIPHLDSAIGFLNLGYDKSRNIDHLHRYGLALELADALLLKHTIEGDSAILDYVIKLLRWVRNAAQNYLIKAQAAAMEVTCLILHRYYAREGPLHSDDALQMIALAEAAIVWAPSESYSLDAMCKVLTWRYDSTGTLSYLDNAIACAKNCLKLVAVNHQPSIAVCRCNLARLLITRIAETLSVQDLKAVENLLISVQPTTWGVFSLEATANLACLKQFSYELTRDEEALSFSLRLQDQLLSKIPESHIIWQFIMYDLGAGKIMRFERDDCLHSLDQAVETLERIRNARVNQDARALHVSLLALAYSKKYDKIGRSEDLGAALQYSKLALSLNKSEWRMNEFHCIHGLVLLSQSSRAEGDFVKKLGEAVTHLRLAVELAERYRGTQQQACPYHYLSKALRSQFHHTNKLVDIEESVNYGRRAIQYIPEKHIMQPEIANNLSLSLYEYHKTGVGRDDDLREAFELAFTAFSETPDGHIHELAYYEDLSQIATTVRSSSRELQGLFSEDELELIRLGMWTTETCNLITEAKAERRE